MTDNKERMNLRDLFLKILGCSLWGEAFDGQLSIKEFREVLSLAEEQTVFGLVLDALKDARVEGMEDKTPLFEAIELNVAVGLEDFLKERFGDYMKIPSLERIRYEQHASKWALGEEYQYPDKSDEKYFF